MLSEFKFIIDKKEKENKLQNIKKSRKKKTEYHNRINKQQDWMPENLKIWIEWKKKTKNMLT